MKETDKIVVATLALENGWPPSEIADDLNLDPKTVANLLVKKGTVHVPKWMIEA